MWNLSRKQYSNTLHNIGVMAMPLKSSHIMALVRVSLGFGMGTIITALKATGDILRVGN